MQDIVLYLSMFRLFRFEVFLSCDSTCERTLGSNYLYKFTQTKVYTKGSGIIKILEEMESNGTPSKQEDGLYQ